MLFMLASLACGQNDQSKATQADPTVRAAAHVTDISDDDTCTTESTSTVKQLPVARRRRRPLKKRISMGDYLPSSSSLLFLGSSIKPRKSLLETSIDIAAKKTLAPKPKAPVQVEAREEETSEAVEEPQNDSSEDDNGSSSAAMDVDDEMPTLVSDDDKWKKVHSPLDLPSFLPCPAMALKDVKSICLTLEAQ